MGTVAWYWALYVWWTQALWRWTWALVGGGGRGHCEGGRDGALWECGCGHCGVGWTWAPWRWWTWASGVTGHREWEQGGYCGCGVDFGHCGVVDVGTVWRWDVGTVVMVAVGTVGCGRCGHCVAVGDVGTRRWDVGHCGVGTCGHCGRWWTWALHGVGLGTGAWLLGYCGGGGRGALWAGGVGCGHCSCGASGRGRVGIVVVRVSVGSGCCTAPTCS